jgi:alpha-glucosidase
MLTLYRSALSLRRTLPGLGDGRLTWVEAGQDLLAFHREPGFACVVNLGDKPAQVADGLLPAGAVVALASGPIDADGRIPGATAVWYGWAD